MTSDAAGNQEPMIAPCGLDCEACSIRRAAKDPDYAETLAARWRKGGRTEATAEWFKCQGCRGSDELVWSDDCKIRACCIKTKQLADCSHCGEFPCSLIEAFETDGYAHHAKAVQHLRELRRLRTAGS